MSTLRDFLNDLDRAGELHRVSAEVSPILEIAEIVQRHCRLSAPKASEGARAFDQRMAGMGGNALLFENVTGSDFPLCVNVYGSYARTELALHTESGGFEAIADRIGALTKPEPPTSFAGLLEAARRFLPVLRVPPKTKKRGVCQEVVLRADRGEVDLRRLPMLKCWPLDGDPEAVGFGISAADAGTAGGDGRYITFAGIHTIHADDAGVAKPASHNIGMYRLQLIDGTHLAMHWHMHHDGAAHWRSWKAKGEPMPVAICLGGESVMPYAATAPLPPGLSELLMAGYLNGGGIPLVPAKTVPLRVPANSEIVIEGFVRTDCGPIGFDPRTDGGAQGLGSGAVFEGPFGDHTGFYSLPDRYPILEVTAMTHRRDAVYPTTIVGLPPQEDYYLGKATERVFLPLLKTLIPDIIDYHLPLFGCFHNCAFVQIEKHYPLHARRVMHAIWGAGQMAWTKWIVVVGSDVDVHDEAAVLSAVMEHAHFGRDVEVVNGPLDILDHAAPRLGAGHKWGIDATKTWAGEEVNGVPSDHVPTVGQEAGLQDLAGRLRGRASIVATTVPDYGLGRLLLIAVDKRRAGDGVAAIEAAFTEADDGLLDLVIAVDAGTELMDLDRVWFLACANADPGRDLIHEGDRMAIDATTKVLGDERGGHAVRDFPPILEMDSEIVAKVTSRWAEYGFTES